MAENNRKDLVLNDPRQANEVMVELMFELVCTQNALKDLLVRFLAKGDEAMEETISNMYSEQWGAFREVYLNELADRFDIQDRI